MTKGPPLPPPGFDDLAVEDQIDYVQSLWDRIAAKPDQVPLPEWHKQMLDERLAAHEADPEAAKPWEEVRDEIRSKLGGRPAR
jgi:putative addiction module component (TIGR02574 family)